MVSVTNRPDRVLQANSQELCQQQIRCSLVFGVSIEFARMYLHFKHIFNSSAFI